MRFADVMGWALMITHTWTRTCAGLEYLHLARPTVIHALNTLRNLCGREDRLREGRQGAAHGLFAGGAQQNAGRGGSVGPAKLQILRLWFPHATEHTVGPGMVPDVPQAP